MKYEIVEPTYPVSFPVRSFPPTIGRPNYARNGVPNKHANRSNVKKVEDIAKIWNACRIAKKILMTTGRQVKPGMTCEDIDDIVYELCLKNKCYPSPLRYSNFPKCVTTSVNNVAVHGIPDSRPLLEGDIISIDVSVFVGTDSNGHHGDCCHTFAVGECDPAAKHLMSVAELCLLEAIKVCKAGEKISLIGKTIERVAKSYKMAVIREFCGHGVGEDLHQNPLILHYDHPSDEVMLENMVFTIEPIITESSNPSIVAYEDNWTISTEDNARTAQYEHTIWVKKETAVVLTTEETAATD